MKEDPGGQARGPREVRGRVTSRYDSAMTINRSVRRGIPSFALYGERAAALEMDPLHIESIQSRSSKYLWKIGTHRHVGLAQCVYVTAGPVAIDLEGVHSQLAGPALCIIPAGTIHGFSFQRDTRGYVLTMELNRLIGGTSAVHRGPITALFGAPRIIELTANPALAERSTRLFEVLIQEFNQPDVTALPVSGLLACSLLAVLASRSMLRVPQGPMGDHDFDRLSRFRELLEAHYREHWPVSRYAAELALSESSLNRLSSSLAGATAFEVVQQRLALEARRRLTYVAGPVTMIAAELGFKDPSYFCRFFRKHCGMSPSEFRRRQRA
jgi:AraC family transcriptional activator of pobA